jgi:hypothetical protein
MDIHTENLKSLEESLRHMNGYLGTWTLVVAIGVAGEVVLEGILEFTKTLKKGFGWKKIAIPGVMVLLGSAVAVGVYEEWNEGEKITTTSQMIQTEANAEVQDALDKATKAYIDAKLANEAAKHAIDRARSAQGVAMTAGREAASANERTKPRSITWTSADLEIFKTFSDRTFVYLEDDHINQEARNLAERVLILLNSSQLLSLKRERMTPSFIDIVNVPGVHVLYEDRLGGPDFSIALVRFFQKNGIDVDQRPDDGTTFERLKQMIPNAQHDSTRALVGIYIGRKPGKEKY